MIVEADSPGYFARQARVVSHMLPMARQCDNQGASLNGHNCPCRAWSNAGILLPRLLSGNDHHTLTTFRPLPNELVQLRTIPGWSNHTNVGCRMPKMTDPRK